MVRAVWNDSPWMTMPTMKPPIRLITLMKMPTVTFPETNLLRAVHLAVEIHLALDVFLAASRLFLADGAGVVFGLDGHLLDGQCRPG